MKTIRQQPSFRSTSANNLKIRTKEDKLPHILITRDSPLKLTKKIECNYTDHNEDLKVVKDSLLPPV